MLEIPMSDPLVYSQTTCTAQEDIPYHFKMVRPQLDGRPSSVVMIVR
jgi:hypothetical protein